jgi:hypothetical protein
VLAVSSSADLVTRLVLHGLDVRALNRPTFSGDLV